MAELLCKVGNKYPIGHEKHDVGWKDGQIVDIRPDGFYTGTQIKKHFVLIRIPANFNQMRGDSNLKSTRPSVLDFKKFLTVPDSNGKFAWDQGYLKDQQLQNERDYFVDIKFLLDSRLINGPIYESIYNKNVDHGNIFIQRNLLNILFREDEKQRLNHKYMDAPGSISAGTFSIGSGLDYDTAVAFSSDIAATLTGNLTGEHANEETTITTGVVFNSDTNGFLLKLTAASGAEHDGTGYGNGARISYTGFDAIVINETSADTTNDVEVSKLGLEVSGSGNVGVNFINGGDSGVIICNRLLIRGDSLSFSGIVQAGGNAESSRMTNNIIYNLSSGEGITIQTRFARNTFVANNDLMKNSIGIEQESGTSGGTLITKNNLCQDNSTDFVDAGAGFGTTAKNASEDATSPDSGFRSINCHDGNSCFLDFDNDNYKLQISGDEISSLDDGEDLSATFTDDIVGVTRDTWYIGAWELTVSLPPNDTLASTVFIDQIRPVDSFIEQIRAVDTFIDQNRATSLER